MDLLGVAKELQCLAKELHRDAGRRNGPEVRCVAKALHRPAMLCKGEAKTSNAVQGRCIVSQGKSNAWICVALRRQCDAKRCKGEATRRRRGAR